MIKNNRLLHWLSLLIFSIGILIGMAVAGGIIWGDIEASIFDSSIKAKSALRLSCPVLITTNEAGKISATLKNLEDREREFYVRAHISEGYVSLMREIDQQIPVKYVDPHRSKIISSCRLHVVAHFRSPVWKQT